jgi:UDP-N-acetyl-D-mannosaminuronic acid transferase (WecB/TagA/CpsF family)
VKSSRWWQVVILAEGMGVVSWHKKYYIQKLVNRLANNKSSEEIRVLHGNRSKHGVFGQIYSRPATESQ